MMDVLHWQRVVPRQSVQEFHDMNMTRDHNVATNAGGNIYQTEAVVAQSEVKTEPVMVR